VNSLSQDLEPTDNLAVGEIDEAKACSALPSAQTGLPDFTDVREICVMSLLEPQWCSGVGFTDRLVPASSAFSCPRTAAQHLDNGVL